MQPAAERLAQALEMADLGIRMRRQRYQREHPDASEQDVAAFMSAWLRHRPGAEHGDAEGRPVSLPRR